MHTILVLTGGFVLLALCLAAGRLAGQAMRRSVAAFAFLWLIATGVNLWFGVTRAGYGVAEELPIFLLLFGLPVLAAVAIERNFGRPA